MNPRSLPSVHTPPRWEPATLARCHDLGSDVRLFEVRPDSGATAPYTPGSHLPLQLEFDGHPQTRHYSLLEEAGDAGVYRFAVKRLVHSRGGSEHLWQLAPGDKLTIAGPANHFPLSFANPEYLLIAGGIGITPLYGMALALHRAGKRLRLIYVSRDSAREHFATALSALGAALEVYPDSASAAPAIQRAVATLDPAGEAYLCGPAGLRRHVRALWEAEARPPWALRYETFANGGERPEETFEVSVRNLGISFEVPPHRSLLESLIDHDIEALYDCQRGECGLCAVDVVSHEGSIDHRDVYFSARQHAADDKLCTCVSRIAGHGRVVIDTRRQGIRD
ncbi:PDR/VanB family oxidoreductase [Salinicola sp. RZ23]|uniref:PDR/VanB family oxidoreductase n=1 Tax=Salinicola sp. RZ23 TaxID=1949087 RepID=UPI000DA21C22|nr:PDR/VanB family oxidoreductase [Salinicola sp. RZ23]